MSDDADALFARPCHFIAGAASADSLPPVGPVEIAFAGRSNVGKSSLLNALVNRRDLARVSSQPGRTQQINFFDLAGILRLVDMPGHGYARVSRTLSGQWTKMIEDYIRYRPSLKRVMLLVDGKVGFKESDDALMSLMDNAALSYQIVMTKMDKLSDKDKLQMTDLLAAAVKKRRAAHPILVPTSASDKSGIAALREIIYELALEGRPL